MKGAILLSALVVVMSFSTTAIYDPDAPQDDDGQEFRTMTQEVETTDSVKDVETIETTEEVTEESSSSKGFLESFLDALRDLF